MHMGSESAGYSAQLSSFHTASQDNNPFTVYVVTVRKGNSQWQVFRRYKEWEELRMRLCQNFGNAPPMPGKMLFGRMRPEVIETRVLGLNQFLQLCLSSEMHAQAEDLIDFLEREKNMPPPGLDLVLDPLDTPDTASTEGSAEGQRQAQLKRLVEAASHAFIPVSHDAPPLDPSYLAERAAMYAATLRPTYGPPVGSTVPLKPLKPSTEPISEREIEAALERCLEAAERSTEPSELSHARATATAAAAAFGSVAVQGKHEVLVSVS